MFKRERVNLLCYTGNYRLLFFIALLQLQSKVSSDLQLAKSKKPVCSPINRPEQFNRVQSAPLLLAPHLALLHKGSSFSLSFFLVPPLLNLQMSENDLTASQPSHLAVLSQ